jgi:glycosyltransferase involved in cell wall biosynthesis
MFTVGTVTVVTPATGHANLRKCVESVQGQIYPDVEHLLVVDGADRAAAVGERLSGVATGRRTLHTLTLPYATGKEKWLGHRIQGASAFLCNTEYVCYLDEDNFFDADHIESLMAAMGSTGAVWAFSLRKIVDEKGNVIVLDECESLGNLHPIYTNESAFLVDANCYLLKRELAVKLGPSWYAPARQRGRPDRDSIVCRYLLKHFPKPACNLRHTVNYLAGNRSDSVAVDFFMRGNEAMRKRYPKGMPWVRPAAG